MDCWSNVFMNEQEPLKVSKGIQTKTLTKLNIYIYIYIHINNSSMQLG
jgi:hypothetical protein